MWNSLTIVKIHHYQWLTIVKVQPSYSPRQAESASDGRINEQHGGSCGSTVVNDAGGQVAIHGWVLDLIAMLKTTIRCYHSWY